MPIDSRIVKAVDALIQAEGGVRAAAGFLGVELCFVMHDVFATIADLDHVEVWADGDELILRALFRGRARFDAGRNVLTDAADVEDPYAVETACIHLYELHEYIETYPSLRHWVSERIQSGSVIERPARFFTAAFEGASEDFKPGDPLYLSRGRCVRYPGPDSTEVIMAFVGPNGVGPEGLDVVKPTLPVEDLCLKYTRGQLGPYVAPRRIADP